MTRGFSEVFTMKRFLSYIFVVFLVLALALAMPGDYDVMRSLWPFMSSSVGAQSGPGSENSGEADENKPVTTMETDLELYRGNSTFIDVHYTEGDVVTVTSENPDIVKATSRGRLTAIKSGKSLVTVQVDSAERVYVLQVNVRVACCSYDSIESRGSGLDQSGDSPYIVLYRTCKKGYSGSVSAFGNDNGKKYTYSSTNKNIVSVSSDGGFKALKKGNASIIISEEDAGVSRRLMVISVTVGKSKKPYVAAADTDNWYKKALISGNSVTLGYNYHCNRQEKGYMGDIIHLSAVSYSIMNDKKAVSASSLHPSYQGTKRKVSDHISNIMPEKILLNYGMNDLNIYGVEGAADQYKAFIKEIHNADPDAQIYILSMTPVRRSSGNLAPDRIIRFNSLMETFAGKKSYVSYIDLYSGMVDETGLLKREYCSDGFCHLSDEAYKYWTKVLRKFAKKEIIKETKATDAVKTAVESGDAEDIRNAEALITKLSSAVKRNALSKKLYK